MPLNPKQQRFIQFYLQTNDKKLAAQRAGYGRGRRSVFDLMHHPGILSEIERRRKTPTVEDFVEPAGSLDPKFVLANALELFEQTRLLGSGPNQLSAATRLLEVIQREQANAQATASPYEKDSEEYLAKRISELQRELGLVSPETVAQESAAPAVEPAVELDPDAPWRRAAEPPKPPESEPLLPAHLTPAMQPKKLCTQNPDHGVYTGKQCPLCAEFWRAEAERERRSWNKSLLPAWG